MMHTIGEELLILPTAIQNIEIMVEDTKQMPNDTVELMKGLL